MLQERVIGIHFKDHFYNRNNQLNMKVFIKQNWTIKLFFKFVMKLEKYYKFQKRWNLA